MPLHASATSSVVSARAITLPSRSTGMPAACRQNVAVCAANSCSGKAIAFITIAGSGTMKSRNARGNASGPSHAVPRIRPHEAGHDDDDRAALQEELGARRTHDEHRSPSASTPAPSTLGRTRSRASLSLSFQTKYSASGRIRNPCV